jgi:hypothetical protein
MSPSIGKNPVRICWMDRGSSDTPNPAATTGMIAGICSASRHTLFALANLVIVKKTLLAQGRA